MDLNEAFDEDLNKDLKKPPSIKPQNLDEDLAEGLNKIPQ
ncbi:MAG: hypothetical protein Hyperionvirus3_47 [Hyperionvirus sp.]|uniref:Uncharacterized protein n=1 Tax=Hyperionvirus sp. TaxID=2487770 RepID=A0A3G5A9N7_9VIRU|nr:MAG: hypothetical protein Hyperionvirus3_47 [Hyperionvirus sp.]